MPGPISWSPSQYWDGDLGLWSSFALRAGTPEQNLRVLVSTSATAISLVSQNGCALANPPPNCSDTRGGLFNASQSSTWAKLGNYTLGPTVFKTSATYGLDNVSLGFSDAAGGPKLDRQVIASVASNNYYLGSLGLNNQPTNFTTFQNSSQSFLSSLRFKDLIPSASWAYTAGANYRYIDSKGSLASLTFGGYDATRFKPNNISFALQSDVARDIVPSIKSITASYDNGTAVPLLKNPIWTFIDSTSPFIYLPLEVCQKFEQVLGLTWNATSQLYQLNDQLHQELQASNPKFTFQLADNLKDRTNVEISLPYAAFDLAFRFPLSLAGTRVFPLKRAQNDSQIVLGRTFLQEAYLIVNYDHSNFSLHQVVHENGTKPSLVPLYATLPATPSPSSHVNLPAIIGGVLGGISLIVILLLIWLWRRQHRRAEEAANQLAEEKANQLPKELAASSVTFRSSNPPGFHEMKTRSSVYSSTAQEAEGTEKLELFDMDSPSGSGKTINELPIANRSHIWEMAVTTTPRSRLSKETAILMKEGPPRPLAVFVQKRTSWQSVTSFDTSIQSSVVETTISAMVSPLTINHSHHRRHSRPRTSINLNRPLPPLPFVEEEFKPPLPAFVEEKVKPPSTPFVEEEKFRNSNVF